MPKRGNFHLNKNPTLENKRKPYVEMYKFTDNDQVIKKIFNENEVKNKKVIENKRSSNINKQLKMFNEKNNMNIYYEINLNNIHFMIYDFNKEILLDGNKNEINIKKKNLLLKLDCPWKKWNSGNRDPFKK